MASSVRERSLASELSLLDIEDDLVWQRDGRVTLLYRIRPLHEPALTDEDFDLAAMAAENVWSSLPENTSYQFLVLVDRRHGLAQLNAALRPIAGTSATERLLEEFRQGRLAHLVDRAPSEGPFVIQERRHYLAATFRPTALGVGSSGDWRRWLASAARLVGLSPGQRSRYESAYGRVMNEAQSFHRRVMSALQEQGLAPTRCGGDDLVGLVHELLSPCASEYFTLAAMSARNRTERDGFPRALLDEVPFLGDVAPAWSLTDDDMLVHQRFLQVGDRYATVLNLKELPDSTEPGMLVPLLQLGREKYRVVYRVDIPRVRREYDALRAKANLAEGLRLENFLVQSNRPDPHAEAVGNQSQEAMRKLIAAAQRIFGVSLQVVLYERSPEALEEAVQETLSRMSRAHGLHGHRETFMLKRAYLSTLPGAPPMLERRRKALTPVAVDLMPVFDTVSGEGRIPFLTPSNALVFYDPFDSRAQANANALVTGIPGAGKSVLAQMLLSGYEMSCAGAGDPLPYVFILDNGASYERYVRLREEDGRYVRFAFSDSLVDIFRWSPEDGDLDEHISRLEWLLLDLLKVDQANEERFERKKAAVEEALKDLYAGDGPRDFRAYASALARTAEGPDLAGGLFPFTEGKFARLFTANPALELREDVRAVCYDFMGLAEHPDFAAIALRLVIFEVRRFAARMNRRRHRTVLMLDESWSLLDSRVGRGNVTNQAAPFLTSSIRMGRKEGCAVIALSQNLADFSSSGLGSAVIENSATKFVGISDAAGIESLRQLLQLNPRQVAQVRGPRPDRRLPRVPVRAGRTVPGRPRRAGPVLAVGVHDVAERSRPDRRAGGLATGTLAPRPDAAARPRGAVAMRPGHRVGPHRSAGRSRAVRHRRRPARRRQRLAAALLLGRRRSHPSRSPADLAVDRPQSDGGAEMKKRVVALLALVTVVAAPSFADTTAELVRLLAEYQRALRVMRNISGVAEDIRTRVRDAWPDRALWPLEQYLEPVNSIRDEVSRLSCSWQFSVRMERLRLGLFDGKPFCRREWQAIFGRAPRTRTADLDEYYDWSAVRRLNAYSTHVTQNAKWSAQAGWLTREAQRGTFNPGEDTGPEGRPGYAQRLSALGAAQLGNLMVETGKLEAHQLDLAQERLNERRRRERVQAAIGLFAFDQLAGADPGAPGEARSRRRGAAAGPRAADERLGLLVVGPGGGQHDPPSRDQRRADPDDDRGAEDRSRPDRAPTTGTGSSSRTTRASARSRPRSPGSAASRRRSPSIACGWEFTRGRRSCATSTCTRCASAGRRSA